jgi:3-oxoadipate enol-lactonase
VVIALIIAGVFASGASDYAQTPASARIDSGFVDVAEGRVYYETAGRGEAVVLVHDGLLDRETWGEQFPAFADAYRLIRYDRRGYGRSPAATVTYTNVDDLLALFTALKIDRATLVGCSAGGGVSIDFAIAHPDLVRSLVLVGAVVNGLPGSDHFRTRGGRLPPSPPPSDAGSAIEYWSMTDPYYVSPANPAVKARVKALMTATPHNVTRSDSFLRRPRWSALSRLAEIHVPALIIVGEDDIPDVHAHAGAIQAGIAGSQRVVVSHAGHLVHMEQPAAFNRLLREFLDEKH